MIGNLISCWVIVDRLINSNQVKDDKIEGKIRESMKDTWKVITKEFRRIKG